MQGIPSLASLDDVFVNQDSAVDYLIRKDVLVIPDCYECGRLATLDKKRWQCRCNNKDACRRPKMPLRNAFFGQSRLKFNLYQILHIAYLWITNSSSLQIRTIVGIGSETCCNWLSFMRQLLIWDLETNNIQKSGGPGIIVELDESKFAKRKFNQGHRVVNKDWVFGSCSCTQYRRRYSLPNNRARTD